MSLVLPTFKGVRPAWLSKTWTDAEFQSLTDADWKLMEAELAVYNLAVKNHTTQVMDVHSALCGIIATLYGANSNVTKYIESNSPPRKTWENMTTLTNNYRIYQEAATKREKERLANELLMQATVFLTQRGKVAGVDFNSGDAISRANMIREAELIAEKVNSGQMFSFGGDDYCEDCSGWDGESRRCECGNRRVYWDSEGNFTNMYVYAMAD